MKSESKSPPADAEALRMAEITRHAILDTPPEDRFERIVALARVLFDAPGCAISLIDTDRQWHKARSGMGIGLETAREFSFCNHAIKGNSVFIVPDAKQDDRFSGNPLVEGPPYIRFYAGAPLRSENGSNLGALCILSTEPRAEFTAADQKRLEALAGVVVNEMELRYQSKHRDQNNTDKEQEIKSQLQEAYYRIKNKLEYTDLIAEIQTGALPLEKLSALAVAAWEQHLEADGVLANTIRSLRRLMTPAQYKELLKSMPGFTI
jgi:GAF domain-containing protein